jgi:putrescine aminotransferase
MAKSARTEELIKTDLAHVLHPFCMHGTSPGVVFEKTRDRIYMVDTEGKEYIDCTSGLMCVNAGHGQKAIQDAICDAVRQIDYTSAFYGFSNVYAIECAKMLSEITPGDLKHFQFVSGGSEATDTAVKMARLYWHHKGMGTKQKIIGLINAYHGQTGISTYMTRMGQGMVQRGYGAEPSGYMRVPGFFCYRCQFGATYPGCDMLCARFLKSIIDSEGADSIAAFFAEPIQGSGGVIAPPPEYWPMVRKICTDSNILLIGDEVMSGFTRCGKMFAFENFGIAPDMMIMAKGINSAYLPLGAVAFNEEIHETLKGKLYTQGVTYSAHPIPCAASVATLKLYKEQNVAANSAKVGSHIKQRLEKEFLTLPCVGDIGGGYGMFLSMELLADKKSKTILDPAIRQALWSKCLEKGLYVRITGTYGNRLFICPPCTMTIQEADKMLDTLLPLVAEVKTK